MVLRVIVRWSRGLSPFTGGTVRNRVGRHAWKSIGVPAIGWVRGIHSVRTAPRLLPVRFTLSSVSQRAVIIGESGRGTV